MGEGGYLLLANGTPYTWKRGDRKSYQMAAWNFPRQVKPGAVATVYVEFKQSVTTKRSDTSGYCVYLMATTRQCAFRIEVRDAPSNLKVQLQGLSTPNNCDRGWIQLGWQHDGIVCFTLSGHHGNFASSNPPRDWMQQNLSLLGDRSLHKICMPGTHDAGVGEITYTDVVPGDIMAHYAQTQSLKILGQLEMGSRYFDIRPVISGGAHWTGHYGGKLGARGQKISSIVDDINEFTKHCAELIILNLSHSLQTDKDWREYNQREWNLLYAELMRLDHRFVATGSEADDLSLLPLSRFIGSGHAAVVIVVEAPGDIQLSGYEHHGFYLPHQLNVFNEYSNTNDCVTMVQDQVLKMQKHMQRSDKRVFLISWTLTQQPPDVQAVDFTPPHTLNGLAKMARWKAENKTIRQLAYSANKALLKELLPYTGPTAFPNIVYIDYMETTDYVALAMAINHRTFTDDDRDVPSRAS